MMDSKEAYGLLSQWLLTQNSSAAAWVSQYPHLFQDLGNSIGQAKFQAPPPLEEPFDEESAQARLRLWLGQGLVSLNMAGIRGKSRPAIILDRLTGLIAGAVERALIIADLSLRQRYHHPLLISPEGGPGPVSVLAWGPLAGREISFTQSLGLVFLFSRSPRFAGPRAEEELAQARNRNRKLIILKEYVLKTAGLVMTFLGMEHPGGPALSMAAPEGWPQEMVGPQLNSLARFSDFFRHKANDAQLFSLARMRPLGGQAKLGKEVKGLAKELLLSRFVDREITVATQAGLRAEVGEGLDPANDPGGLGDLGLFIDGLLLANGIWSGRSTGDRIRKAANLGLLDSGTAEELKAAHETLLRAHLICSLLDRRPENPAQYEAALALWPGRRAASELSLGNAREIVAGRLDEFIGAG